jgi:hypothetical protein
MRLCSIFYEGRIIRAISTGAGMLPRRRLN